MNTTATKNFEATIYEKAEHWTFDVTVKAENDADAWKQLAKDYPKRSYSIRDCRQCYGGRG